MPPPGAPPAGPTTAWGGRSPTPPQRLGETPQSDNARSGARIHDDNTSLRAEVELYAQHILRRFLQEARFLHSPRSSAGVPMIAILR